jgi:hypothetical protein
VVNETGRCCKRYCDVYLCSLHSAHTNFTMTMHLRTHLQLQ